MRLRIPRSLIDARQQDLPPADDEGLVTVQLQLEAGVVQRIDAAPAALGAAAPLAITPPVDAHAHLDKTFSHGDFPNPGGTMGGALAANRLTDQLADRVGPPLLHRPRFRQLLLTRLEALP